ncbi:MAG: ABC transporter ATP-binding protein [Clostridia bacterium]|nr:ABC transporter ATP-binding protein [Clostridia bacterium]MBR1683700.1 ABC transporter ATP-binding protein [Clostridia bacterium]MBR2287677.1 ABC transporter ATP-binding protein [Clostridia bacterium]
MRFLWKYVKPYRWAVVAGMGLKLCGTVTELLIPYVMEHLIDNVVPRRDMTQVLLWGVAMLVLACVVRFLNVNANRLAVKTARKSIFAIRRDLFHAALNLSGDQMDEIGLPSVISRMTSDTYNVQSFIQSIQTIGIRAPIMLLGGIGITLTMDLGLASILCIMAPIMIVLVVLVSRRGIPLYEQVQKGMDDIVRVMRENITGIRVVKALSKEPYEMRRFSEANETTTKRDIRASITMAMPGPIVTLFLNLGLTLVVYIGARRVNSGVTQPGVILAFLTYFNMILMGVMGLNRVFMMLSKANASSQRIAQVAGQPDNLAVLLESQAQKAPKDGYIVFDHVSFSYGETSHAASAEAFAGQERQKCLTDIDFVIPKGGSLGIIGATGAGKTTIINLLMRFYDTDEGHVYVDGKDVRTWDRDELHRRFGVVFQNDAIFATSIRENVVFGRKVDDTMLKEALSDAMAAEFVGHYADGVEHEATIHGANFSGGQKQRLLISRALAAKPDILVLDDSSSALDYRTDAELRRAIREHHSDATTIVIAQRVSSIMSLDQIIVLDEGKVIGKGTHEELLASCPVYAEIHRTQMGEVA